MKNPKILEHVATPPTHRGIETRKKEPESGSPRWFRSTGNPLVGLHLTGATGMHLLTDARRRGDEIGQHISKAQHL